MYAKRVIYKHNNSGTKFGLAEETATGFNEPCLRTQENSRKMFAYFSRIDRGEADEHPRPGKVVVVGDSSISWKSPAEVAKQDK